LSALSLFASFSFTRAASALASTSVNSSAFIVSADGSTKILTSKRQSSTSTTTRVAASNNSVMADPVYPGTAVERMFNVRNRVKELSTGTYLLYVALSRCFMPDAIARRLANILTLSY
jgi:hypothetical protein